MHTLGELVEIQSAAQELSFRCSGDYAEQETIFSKGQDGITQTKTANEIVQGNFLLKYLVLFTKCTNLCTSTQIHLKNDYPLVLRYMVANLGEVRLVLAPQKQKTEPVGRPQKV
jgi:hypothetical protein